MRNASSPISTRSPGQAASTSACGQRMRTWSWREPHPINESQEGFEYLLTFAPRDAEELEVVKAIVRCSYEWTIGPVDESEA
jgi:hypothetical protein